MLGKLFKKKKQEKDEPVKPVSGRQLNFNEAPLRERKKREEAKGPSWGPLVLLLVTMGVGMLFWMYGNIKTKGKTGWEGLGKIRLMPEQAAWEIDETDEGVIIFEKE